MHFQESNIKGGEVRLMKPLTETDSRIKRDRKGIHMPKVQILQKLGFTTSAMIHSKKAIGECEIVGKSGDNQYVAKIKERFFTAIFNPFVGVYYVDDIYGEVTI